MKRIYLIGYMGAGKTTVGKILAEHMGLSFIDLDNYIESRYLKTVRNIFEESGEAEFRKIEQKMLKEVSEFENVIISTGGGTPCYEDNMKFMCAVGKPVYLRVSIEELAKRLEISNNVRPVLKGRKGESLRKFISESLQTREPFYNQASIIFDAEVMLTETDVDNIVKALHKLL